jgi:hypothetical protein
MLIRTVCYEFFSVMAILEILKYPDPLLHKVATPVKNITGTTAQLIEDLLDTMYAAPGVRPGSATSGCFRAHRGHGRGS